jgi:hypothetical protein
MLEWFRDPRVSTSDLRVLTAAVATRSGAEGVDQTMALSMTAKSDERAKLRDLYAKVWGLGTAAARVDSGRQWVMAAQGALIYKAPANDRAAQLALAAELAKLSTAAATIWRGGTPPDPVAFVPPPGATVDETLNQPGATPSNVIHIYGQGPTGGGVSAATGNGQDGVWARDYLAEKHSIPGREKQLDELRARGRPIGPIDAGLLAQAACSESPWKVREQAQTVLRVFMDEPALVNALLDFLPIAPRTTDVSRLYADVTGAALPRVGDPRWETETRRALLTKVMSMLTTTGVHGEVERSTLTIAGAYLGAVGKKLNGTGSDEAADGAVAGAAELAEDVRREAASSPVAGMVKMNLDAVERRRQQRRLQAVGPVQAFIAEQSGLVELLGYSVAAERPASEAAVTAVLEEAAGQRRKAEHAFEQVLANERALVRLWLARFGGGT